MNCSNEIPPEFECRDFPQVLTKIKMNITELLNAQLEATKKDREHTDAEILKLELEYKKAKTSLKLQQSVLNSVIADIEKKIDKLEGNR